ncbi:ATP-dependent nuclease [Flavobacterium sp. HNIBRBA15423]|uniref:ATP-dependent nuclease n=1 Tax=Flavobacterium sp. HNIBRBA15423 TaxID=3458683 RepID=UPI0040449FBF
MYISELKLWNFRKYGIGSNDLDLENPHLNVPLEKGMNIIIGQNDSGKSAILDAIKLVLKTHAYEWIKVEKSDFHSNTEKLRIEIHFKGITDDEAKHFIEWLGWDNEKQPRLILIYQAEYRNNRILPSDVKAGMDGTGFLLNAEAREYLKCTYLKALRDADSELMAKKNSRLSQILQEHKLFKKKKGDTSKHQIEQIFEEANGLIKNYFNEDIEKIEGQKSNKKQIAGPINEFLKDFIDDDYLSKFDIAKAEIKNILEKISLGIEERDNLGLGTMNRLFMAAELLHLKKEKYDGLKLCMVEELEAHLHPQAQMKIIETLDREANTGIQFILTTHSSNIASKVDLKSLIICKNNNVFPLGEDYTYLGEKTKESKYENSYKYLKRFLDVTKSNLFFAKGVILVEGWSEEILIPEIAKKINCDLTKKEVSIVNVGSTAYLDFAKVFLRKENENVLKVPVSIVTDLDIREYEREAVIENGKQKKSKDKKQYTYINQDVINHDKLVKEKENQILDKQSDYVKPFVSKQWTFEWCLLKSKTLGDSFKEVLQIVHKNTFNVTASEDDWEKGLAKLLLSKNLNKTELSYALSENIKNVNTLDFSADDTFYYIVDAIKHACKNGN